MSHCRHLFHVRELNEGSFVRERPAWARPSVFARSVISTILCVTPSPLRVCVVFFGKMRPPARDRVHFCNFCNPSRAKVILGSSSGHFSKRTFSLERCCKNRACSFQSGFLATCVVQSVLFSVGKTHGFRPHLDFTILSRTFTSGAESP